MKTLFIHAKSNEAVLPAVEKAAKLLGRKVGLVTTIQHRSKLKEAKKLLESKGKKVFTAGTVLGCDVSNAKKIEKKVDAFLYIGTGEFHPLGIALETKKPVIIANPSSGNVSRIKKSDAEKIRKKTKGAYIKFLTAKKIGILVSTKPGQNNLKQALALKKKLKDKETYIFIANEIDSGQFENFPFIECWVNTACPRIADNIKGMVNIEDITAFSRR
ncbi:diphthamide synthesis protein [Candidatus Woesearchaeota archaeon]|nr:diphthamide synthesis protein [Candidatus Woesearchaeota archaeon]